jgi:prepilin-type N-terminal cleavage/methylation domain-containing protein
MNVRCVQGFTLVEVMATTAIVGLLLTATLGVTVNLSRSTAILEPRHERDSLADRLDSLLETDMVHTVRLRRDKDAVELQSRQSLDAKTLAPAHVPSTVRYEIKEIEGRRWLIRRQTTGSRAELVSLLCPDARKIGIEAPGLQNADGDRKWTAMDEVATVTVEFADGRSFQRSYRVR